MKYIIILFIFIVNGYGAVKCYNVQTKEEINCEDIQINIEMVPGVNVKGFANENLYIKGVCPKNYIVVVDGYGYNQCLE